VRSFLCCALALMAANSALATPERDRIWDSLIAEAQRRGGSETRLDKSTSYVFQRPDGVYVTFTHSFANGVRAVCLVSKDQKLVVCDDWDTGKLRYGWRADAAAAWTQSDNPPSADQKTPIDMLLGFLAQILNTGAESTRGSSMHGYWRTTATGMHWVNRR
jgi:hypothetical protein